MRRSVSAILILSLFLGACSTNNVTVDSSLQNFFDSAGVKGTFALFDNGHGHFTICDLPRFSDSFYTPGATFDIIQSLIAIQTGVLKDDSALLPGGNSSATLLDGFQDTAALARSQFGELAGRIGRDTLKKWIDSLQYGNKNIGDGASRDFWANGALRINGDQELGLLKKLYFNQLPFFDRTQESVCRLFTEENKTAYRLSYKMAQETEKDGHAVGWVMGWVEENKHPYFFVVNLGSADPNKDLRGTGLIIARKILQRLGFFGGLM